MSGMLAATDFRSGPPPSAASLPRPGTGSRPSNHVTATDPGPSDGPGGSSQMISKSRYARRWHGRRFCDNYDAQQGPSWDAS